MEKGLFKKGKVRRAAEILPQILGSRRYRSFLNEYENVDQAVRTVWDPVTKKATSNFVGYVVRFGKRFCQSFQGIASKKKDAKELVYQMLLRNSVCTPLVDNLLYFENRLKVPMHMTRMYKTLELLDNGEVVGLAAVEDGGGEANIRLCQPPIPLRLNVPLKEQGCSSIEPVGDGEPVMFALGRKRKLTIENTEDNNKEKEEDHCEPFLPDSPCQCRSTVESTGSTNFDILGVTSRAASPLVAESVRDELIESEGVTTFGCATGSGAGRVNKRSTYAYLFGSSSSDDSDDEVKSGKDYCRKCRSSTCCESKKEKEKAKKDKRMKSMYAQLFGSSLSDDSDDEVKYGKDYCRKCRSSTCCQRKKEKEKAKKDKRTKSARRT